MSNVFKVTAVFIGFIFIIIAVFAVPLGVGVGAYEAYTNNDLLLGLWEGVKTWLCAGASGILGLVLILAGGYEL